MSILKEYKQKNQKTHGNKKYLSQLNIIDKIRCPDLNEAQE